MLNDFKTYLKSSLVYYKEYFLFFIILIVIFFLLSEHSISVLVVYIITLAVSFYVMYKVGKRRNNELSQIESIIKKIRGGGYNTADEIVLSKHLMLLEKEIKQMYQRSTDDIKHLERLQKVRSQFIANVSHELRTPIFTIQGFIETLLDGAIDDPKVNKHFLQKANQHTISLSNLLNDLIDISMIESGEMRMSYRFFRVNEYIKEIIRQLTPQAEEKGLKLNYQPVKDSLEVFGDKEKLKQVFVNLIQNAIKYTDKGVVEVIIEEGKKNVKFIIKDTGIGIPESSINRIFERFYRVDKARSRSVGGTGLGLAIVKHILEAHSSTVEVQSVLNEGSEFFFKLKK